MYLVKRTNEKFFTYAYEPTDQVLLLNGLALSNWKRDPKQVFTVLTGRPRNMTRFGSVTTIYEIQENKKGSGVDRVAGFEITPVVPLTPDEYKVLVSEWEKNQMIELLLRGVNHGITD